MKLRHALLPTLLLGFGERALLGHRPVYDVDRMGLRPLRWIYGPALALIQRKLRAPWLLFGPAVAAFELYALPRLGLTPKPRRWPKGEVPLLFAHATLFALAAEVL
ncbi:MAG TPA: hypothetical protein VLW85_22290 [Myxococcales bacterium]|nr:hypothetical protein [Myxococcales bacterium]